MTLSPFARNRLEAMRRQALAENEALRQCAIRVKEARAKLRTTLIRLDQANTLTSEVRRVEQDGRVILQRVAVDEGAAGRLAADLKQYQEELAAEEAEHARLRSRWQNAQSLANSCDSYATHQHHLRRAKELEARQRAAQNNEEAR